MPPKKLIQEADRRREVKASQKISNETDSENESHHKQGKYFYRFEVKSLDLKPELKLSDNFSVVKILNLQK